MSIRDEREMRYASTASPVAPQLGRNLPGDRWNGAVDARLIGTFVLYHAALGAGTHAFVAFRTVSRWLRRSSAALAFIPLRRISSKNPHPALSARRRQSHADRCI